MADFIPLYPLLEQELSRSRKVMELVSERLGIFENELKILQDLLLRTTHPEAPKPPV